MNPDELWWDEVPAAFNAAVDITDGILLPPPVWGFVFESAGDCGCVWAALPLLEAEFPAVTFFIIWYSANDWGVLKSIGNIFWMNGLLDEAEFDSGGCCPVCKFCQYLNNWLKLRRGVRLFGICFKYWSSSEDSIRFSGLTSGDRRLRSSWTPIVSWTLLLTTEYYCMSNIEQIAICFVVKVTWCWFFC